MLWINLTQTFQQNFVLTHTENGNLGVIIYSQRYFPFITFAFMQNKNRIVILENLKLALLSRVKRIRITMYRAMQDGYPRTTNGTFSFSQKEEHTMLKLESQRWGFTIQIKTKSAYMVYGRSLWIGTDLC